MSTGPYERRRAASPSWAASSAFERAACCESVVAAITARRDELAHALSEDQGKPLVAEAYGEVDELIEYFKMAGEDAKRLEGSLPPSTSAGARVLVARVPLGVVGIVSPWNWPYTMGAEVFAPALAAGNTVVWVPAPTTAACSALLAEVIAEGALPPGVFNFLPGPGPVVGDAVVAHPEVDAVGFVGSVATGRRVAERAAGKTQILELGRQRPDGHPRGRRPRARDRGDARSRLPVRGPELHRRRALPRPLLGAGRVRRAGRRRRRPNGSGSATPSIPSRRWARSTTSRMRPKFDAHVADARERGAKTVCGGSRAKGHPTRLFAEATVLDGVTLEMVIARDETFGPVVP